MTHPAASVLEKCECHQCTWLRANQLDRAFVPKVGNSPNSKDWFCTVCGVKPSCRCTTPPPAEKLDSRGCAEFCDCHPKAMTPDNKKAVREVWADACEAQDANPFSPWGLKKLDELIKEAEQAAREEGFLRGIEAAANQVKIYRELTLKKSGVLVDAEGFLMGLESIIRALPPPATETRGSK